MSKRPYFAQYESPNIVIVPTVSFCGVSAKKKIKSSRHFDEVQPKNARPLERSTCSSSKLDNNCSSSKNTNKRDSGNISLATNKNLVYVKPIKLIRLTSDSGLSDKVSNEKGNNEMSSVCKELNKQVNTVEKEKNKHISKSSIAVEINLSSKIDKGNANNNKKRSLKNTSNNSCNSLNKAVNKNSIGAGPKSTDNQHTILSSHKDKKHSKHDDIRTHENPRHPTKEISQQFDSNADSKTSKNRYKQSSKLIKHDSHDRSKAEQQKRNKSCRDKIRHKSESENKYHSTKTLKDDTHINYCSNTIEPKKDTKKHYASKCKHEMQRHGEKKDTHNLISKSKHISKNKGSLTNQEKCKIQEESDTTKCNTNTIISKKTHSNDGDKNKKISSANNSAHNKTHKIKSSRSESDTKNKTQKQTQAIISSNPSHKKDSLNDSYENLTVTVKTQSEKHENSRPPKTKILTTTHKSKKNKLIIHFVVKNGNNVKTAPDDESCTKKEDNVSLISNSELSFLDDIDIDEIVDILKQPKREPGTKPEPIILNRSPEGPIIIIDDDSDEENNIVYNKNSELKGIKAKVKIEEDDKLKDIKPISEEKINTTHCSNNYINLPEESNPNTSNNNTSPLTATNITKREVIDEDMKNEIIEILDEDDTVETLSTCSTVILDSQMDSEECNDISENEKDSLVSETTQSAVHNKPTITIGENIECTNQLNGIVLVQGTENTDYIECTVQLNEIVLDEGTEKTDSIECTDQLNEIVLVEETKNTETFKDPIEAQLKKIFEMPSSDIFDTEVDKNLSRNIDGVKETELACKEEPEVIPSLPQNKELNAVEEKDCDSLDNTKNNVECSAIQATSDIANTPVKINEAVVESQKANIHRIVTTRLLKSVKSEIRKVEEQKSLPVTQAQNFIEALEARMSTFLKTPYTVTSMLHKGKHSRIYECIDKGGFNYALKMLNNIRDRYFMGIQKENMLMSFQKDIPKENLHCVYVLNGFSMCGHWCFLMEYYPKNLFEALQENNKSFHIDTVQVLSKQLIAAVTVLRNNNIVHSDIKPSHILINSKNDRIKLCGFDTAYNIKEAVIAPNIGTSNYRAPEVILGHSSGFSLDVWSSALVMYELATNTKLFPGFYNNDILYKQMCTLGSAPYEMVQKSIFKENHFYGTSFMRRVGSKKEIIKFIYSFKKSKRIHRTLFDAYTADWSDQRTEKQRTEDLQKLVTFKILLEQMLAIHPKHRLSIEFVYANPFIYEFTDVKM